MTSTEPALDQFTGSGECPSCRDPDPWPGLYFAVCCGRDFCWDCYWRKHEKDAVSSPQPAHNTP